MSGTHTNYNLIFTNLFYIALIITKDDLCITIGCISNILGVIACVVSKLYINKDNRGSNFSLEEIKLNNDIEDENLKLELEKEKRWRSLKRDFKWERAQQRADKRLSDESDGE